MDEILHHYMTIGNHCSLVFTIQGNHQSLFRWCSLSSIHSINRLVGLARLCFLNRLVRLVGWLTGWPGGCVCVSLGRLPEDGFADPCVLFLCLIFFFAPITLPCLRSFWLCWFAELVGVADWSWQPKSDLVPRWLEWFT